MPLNGCLGGSRKSGIGTDSYFRCLLSNDVVKCTAGQLGTGPLWARTLLSRSEMIRGGLLEVFNVVLF